MDLGPQVGLLGGSFDPVHRAHVALARAALDTLGLVRVELLPAGRPWQRGQLGAPAQDRLNMLQLVCQDEPRLVINPIEIDRAGDTYTIDTLLALPRPARYTWILGADQLANFCTWHRWRDIVQQVRLAVAERPGTPIMVPAPLAAALAPDEPYRIPFAALDISSTAIREAIATGRPVDDMLDARVLEYIRGHGLYRHAAASVHKPSPTP